MRLLPKSPAKPRFTEANLEDLKGKVFIVTGSTSGVGKELAQILYARNAKVYLAARSSAKATLAISEISAAHPKSEGQLVFLPVDFSDLTGIKTSASQFLEQEERLDVLWNNAGIMIPPQGSKSAQGYEAQLGTNNLGSFLFTKLLMPTLERAAATAPKGQVRVVWVSSSAAAAFSPKGAVDMNNLDYKTDASAWRKYGVSKAGNILHAREMARRKADTGVLSVALDPGNLATDLYRQLPAYQYFFVKLIALKPAIFGAYTELFAGLSPEVTPEKNGSWIAPFGAFDTLRPDIELACKEPEQGGTGVAREFWDWTEAQVDKYA